MMTLEREELARAMHEAFMAYRLDEGVHVVSFDALSEDRQVSLLLVARRLLAKYDVTPKASAVDSAQKLIDEVVTPTASLNVEA